MQTNSHKENSTSTAISPDDARLRTGDLTFELPADVFSAPIIPAQGDHVLDPDLSLPPVKAKAAAVLIPMIAHDDGVSLLLTLRTSRMRTHAGQIAFPGGRVDKEDPSPVHTALRETQEEIGVSEDWIDVQGYLDPYQSGTGYRIVPVVGIVKPGFELDLNPHEVVEAFEVPLDFLMAEKNHRRHRWERDGVLREAWAMSYRDRFIWGVTAGIIRMMWDRLYRP